MLHLLEGHVSGHITEDRNRKKSNAQQELNPRPLLRGVRSTAVLQPLPLFH